MVDFKIGDINLVEKCDFCINGKNDNGKTCSWCQGDGFYPNELGESLLDFLSKYLKHKDLDVLTTWKK